MKKPILFLALSFSVIFFSNCSDDDDNESCKECTIIGATYDVCDNGDGTVTVSGNGVSQKVSVSFDDYDCSTLYFE